jgi:hypothetical protein
MGQRAPAKAIKKYFQSFLYPEDDAFKHDKEGDRFKRLKEVEPRSLDGTLLKSFGEVEIANFLLLNGVRIEYEKPYEIDTADSNKRQYWLVADIDVFFASDIIMLKPSRKT